MKKRALITGINGMDGSHLADFLLEKDYEVFGMERRTSTPNRTNTSHLEGKITFLNGDLTDQNSLVRCLVNLIHMRFIILLLCHLWVRVGTRLNRQVMLQVSVL